MIVNGMQIVFTSAALAETEERLFPESRHRSRRVTKKLIKRYGGVYKKKPVMYQMGGKIFAHPSYKAELLRQTRDRVL